MEKQKVRTAIEQIGIIPALRLSSAEDARFAAEAVASGGIPIVEVTMTVPGAMEVIAELVRHSPDVLVGAGTIFEIETARHCLDAGASFLTSTGLDPGVVDFAAKAGVVVLPGALTPTEVMMAWKAGADFVKIFPCSQVGGAGYIRALKAPLIAAGGVNQQTAGDFIRAGAVALGIGRDLIPPEAIERRQPHRIQELAHRFVAMVQTARSLKLGH